MLEQCHDWLVDNKLSLHLGKTESILFGPSRKVKCVGENSFNISCHGFKIEMKTCVKYLGVMLDNMLSGELIVQNIITKVNQRMKFLYRNSKCLSIQSRKTLCSALIQSLSKMQLIEFWWLCIFILSIRFWLTLHLLQNGDICLCKLHWF